MSDLEREATELLSELIRFKTVNPPGNERAAVERLAGMLGDAGFEIELDGRTPERPNLVATLRGTGDGPTLGLLSHVDTVLATPEEWTRDPWGGEVVDGEVWGRGAQDMKGQTAAEVAAALDLGHSGWRGKGDLKVFVVVDEENGGPEGAIWLCDNHPDSARCDFLLNEGAGAVIPYDGERYYGVCCAEKGVFRFQVRVHGVAGHASMPAIADNALLRLLPFIERLGRTDAAMDLTEAPERLLDALGLRPEELRARDPRLAAYVEPMLRVTFAPTIVSAGEKINVIPSAATVKVDCRVPPGLGRETAERRVREVLGEEGYDLEFLEEVVGNGSRVDSPLMDAIGNWVAREDPTAKILPTMLPAYTDSRTWRSTFGEDCVAYGFFPQRGMDLYESWPLVHGRDERIKAADLGFAARCYRDVAREICG